MPQTGTTGPAIRWAPPIALDSGVVIFSDYAASNTFVNFDTFLAPDAVYFNFSAAQPGPFYYLAGDGGFDDSQNVGAMSLNVNDPSGDLVILGTTNSYCGPTVVQYSYLQIAAAAALGASDGGLNARYTSSLEVDAYGYVNLYGFSQTVGGLISADAAGVIDNTSIGTTATLTVAFGANATTGSGFTTSSAFSGLILGNGDAANSEGTLALIVTVDPSAAAQDAADFSFSIGGPAPNQFVGGTAIVSPGQFRPIVVRLTGDEGLGLGPLTLGGQGCIFDLNGYNQTVTALTDLGNPGPGGAGHGLITNGSATAPSTLTVQLAAGDDPFAGTIAGPLALNLLGTGSLTLTGANSYSLGTTIGGGTLNIDADAALGAVPASPATNITFTGSGTLQLAAPAAPSPFSGTIAANRNLLVTTGNNATFDTNGNSIAYSGVVTLQAGATLTKADSSGAGTLELDGAPTLGDASALLVTAGTLKLSYSNAPAIGSGVTVTVANGATLELAGSASALSAGSNRANIINNSSAAAGLIVSGGNQQVGNIDGAGVAQVAAGAELTANHIVAAALFIGGAAGNPALVAIDASNAAGQPLSDSPASLLGDLDAGSPISLDSLSSPDLFAPASLLPST